MMGELRSGQGNKREDESWPEMRLQVKSRPLWWEDCEKVKKMDIEDSIVSS